MPECNESEDSKHVGNPPDLACPATSSSSQRNVDITNDPPVEAPMPGSPERQCGVIVGHTSDDVLGWVNAVDQGPEAEETPWKEELEPDDVQVEVGEHAELEGCVG